MQSWRLSTKQIPAAIIFASLVIEPLYTTDRNNFVAYLEMMPSLLSVHPVRVKEKPCRRKLCAILDDLMQHSPIPWRVRDDIIRALQILCGEP